MSMNFHLKFLIFTYNHSDLYRVFALLIRNILLNFWLLNFFFYRITSGRFKEIAKEIAIFFSNNNAETAENLQLSFFAPYQKSADGKKAVNSSGILYEHYLFKRNKFIKLGITDKSKIIQQG